MLDIAFAILGHLAMPPALPPYPAGTWACTLSDQVVGTLVVEGPNYLFTDRDAGTAVSGKLVASTADLGPTANASFVRVSSGPLNDVHGVGLGFYNRADAETLVFNVAPGKGITCARR